MAVTRLPVIVVSLAASALIVSACSDANREERATPERNEARVAESDAGEAVPTERDDAPIGPPIERIDDMKVQVGERRLYPLGTHCGISPFLQLNGQYWALAETPIPFPETGAGDQIPDDWPTDNRGVLGYVGLHEDNTIRYSLPDGTVLAIYEPAEPPPTQGGCA